MPGQPIDFYSLYDLQQVVRWVLSDGRLRTDDEILSEVVTDLAFSRRGSRIVSATSRRSGACAPPRPL